MGFRIRVESINQRNRKTEGKKENRSKKYNTCGDVEGCVALVVLCKEVDGVDSEQALEVGDVGDARGLPQLCACPFATATISNRLQQHRNDTPPLPHLCACPSPHVYIPSAINSCARHPIYKCKEAEGKRGERI